MNYIIGVDIGTTNSKAVAYAFDGKVLFQANVTYSPLIPAEGFHELDPAVLYNAVISVLSKTVSGCKGHHLSGVAFSSAMHGLIAVNKSGDPITNMITWADLRSSSFAKSLKNTETGKLIYQRTGTPVHAMSPLCKLMWMKENERELFEKAYKFISIKEFIFYRLFGRYVVDHSVASSTGLFDIHNLTWNREALDCAGISEERLSGHVSSTTLIRGLIPEMASVLGINSATPFVIGGSDGCMAHIGSNALKPRDVSLTIGTSGAIRIMNDRPVDDTKGRIFNYLINDELYLSGGPVNNGGNVLQWFTRNMLQDNFVSPAEMEGFIEQAMSVPPGCDGLVFLPYLHGERAPVWDADARGIFFGVTASHNISHFMRAALEGVSFSLYSILRVVEEINGPANDIYASGGFIRSKQWVSLLADVLGKELHVTHSEDSSAAGAAILGLQALGIINQWQDASSFFDSTEVYAPDMQQHEVYLRNYEVYSKLYNKFTDLNL